MAIWCKDNLTTALTGELTFNKPYPRPHGDWIADREWNEFPLEAMHHVTKAVHIFSKPEKKWTAEEDAFYIEMRKATDGSNS